MNCETKKSTFGILVPFRCHFILSSIQFGMAQQLCYTFVSIVCHGWIGESSKWHLEDLVDAQGLCANIGVEEWESEREGGQKHTRTQNWIIQIANRKSYTHSTRIPWISAVFSGISAFFSFIWSHRMKAKTYPPDSIGIVSSSSSTYHSPVIVPSKWIILCTDIQHLFNIYPILYSFTCFLTTFTVFIWH